MEKLKLKKATTIASLGSNQRKIVNYINDNISEGSNNSGTTTPPNTPGLPDESISTDNLLIAMDLGKCSINYALFLSGFKGPTLGSLKDYIKFEKDGEDITDTVYNLKDGSYMWMFDDIQLSNLDYTIPYDEWLVSIKASLQSQGISIRRFFEMNGIEVDSSATDDDLYNELYQMMNDIDNGGGITSVFGIFANMASSYFIRVRRKQKHAFVEQIQYQYGDLLFPIQNIEYDSVLEWNIASSVNAGNMSFVEFIKDGHPVLSVWLLGLTILYGG